MLLSIVPDADLSTAQVIKVSDLMPAPSGSGELILHGEDRQCHVALLVFDTDSRTSMAAVATFKSCLQSVFGYPNDEASSGDQRLDLGGYGFFEVINSPWLSRLQTYNRLAFPDASWWPQGRYRHFLMNCHESRGEFLAEDLRIRTFPDFQGAASTAFAWAMQ